MSEQEKILNSGLLEQYVLGLLEGEELSRVEQLIVKHPELFRHVKSLQEAMEQVLQENAITPPQELRETVFSKIDALEESTVINTPVKKANRGLNLTSILLATLAITASVFAYLFYQGKTEVQHKLDKKIVELAALKQSCDEKSRMIAASEEIQAFLTGKSTQPVVLNGTELSPNSTAVAYWNEEQKKAYFNVQSLPQPPAGKEYQLWADVEGEMINIGTFDPSTTDLQSIKTIAHAESLNVTLEDIGQNKVPTVSQLYITGIVI